MDTPTPKPDTQRIVRALLADARNEHDKLQAAARRAEPGSAAPRRPARASRTIRP